MELNEQQMCELVEEARENPYSGDSIGVYFNPLGYQKFKSTVAIPADGAVPVYTLSINPDNITSILKNLIRLLPYQKGLQLKLTAPQKRRKLIGFLSETILEFIRRTELSNYSSIIHELTANGEKANLEDVIALKNLANDEKESLLLIRNERDTLFQACEEKNKWVKVSWKFSNKIIKVEIKNNTPINNHQIDGIKDKVETRLNTLADGFVEEPEEDHIGAGLGLFFINFFRDDLKEKYNFETLFRVYQNDFQETVTTFTVIFDKGI